MIFNLEFIKTSIPIKTRGLFNIVSIMREVRDLVRNCDIVKTSCKLVKQCFVLKYGRHNIINNHFIVAIYSVHDFSECFCLWNFTLFIVFINFLELNLGSLVMIQIKLDLLQIVSTFHQAFIVVFYESCFRILCQRKLSTVFRELFLLRFFNLSFEFLTFDWLWEGPQLVNLHLL